MKVLAILLLCMVAMTTAQQQINATQILGVEEFLYTEENGAKEAIQVVGGIILGAFGKFSSISACYSSSRDVFHDFTNAFHNLKVGSHTGVKSGIIHIGKALLELPNALKSCKDIQNLMLKIKKVAPRFSNPTLLAVTVGKNILWHSRSIYKEVKGAISNYQGKHYYNFGTNIGHIINIVFLKKESTELSSDAGNFFKGFAHGVSPSTYVDVEECLNNVDPEMLERIKSDIEDISVKHLDRSIKDVQDIGMAFAEIINACSDGKEDVKELAEKLIKAFTGNVFLEAAITILKNPLKFAELVNKTQEDFKHQYYFAAGEDVGTFVGNVLKTNDVVSVVETLL